MDQWWQWVLVGLLVWYEGCALVVSIDAMGSWRDEIGPWGDLLMTLVVSQFWIVAFTRWMIFYIRLVEEARYGRENREQD